MCLKVVCNFLKLLVIWNFNYYFKSLSAQENASLSEVRGKSLQTPGDRQSMCQYW